MAETEINNRFDFLEAPEGKELFARIDFALKDGMHIQNRTKQSEWKAGTADSESIFT